MSGTYEPFEPVPEDQIVARIKNLETEVEAQQCSLRTEWARVDALEKELGECRAGYETLERQVEHLKTALREVATECSTFPLKEGIAFRCEGIARAALAYGENDESPG